MMDEITRCPGCQSPAARPDVVWFGEIPYHMEMISDHLASCTLFASIGTSGNVYPAAGFVQEALYAGAETLELNLEPTEISRAFHQRSIGPASQVVPDWVATLL